MGLQIVFSVELILSHDLPNSFKMSQHGPVYFECPHCGEDVLAGSKVCRACGASDEAGWNEDNFGDDLDDHYEDPIYQAPREFDAYGAADAAASRVRFWVRLVILALVLSLALGGMMF